MKGVNFCIIIHCKPVELRDVIKVSGLPVHVTTSEGVKANVIIVPIDVTIPLDKRQAEIKMFKYTFIMLISNCL